MNLSHNCWWIVRQIGNSMKFDSVKQLKLIRRLRTCTRIVLERKFSEI